MKEMEIKIDNPEIILEKNIQKSSSDNRQYFEFKGEGKEYFRIWIVNIALTILTLGIYSAWAKVRTNRYFYANTYLNGSNFEYNAEPKRILIGRIVVVLFYGLFILFFQYLFMFKVAGIIALLAFLAMPWLVRQAISFKLRNTSYRHIPFRYSGRTRDFYLFFFLHALLNIFTSMLAFPYSYVKFKALVVNNSHYGDGNFCFLGKASSVYSIYFKVSLWSMGLIFSVSLISLLLGKSLSLIMDEELLRTLLGGAVALFYLSFIFWNKGLSDGYFSNFLRNNTSLESAHLKGELKPLNLAMISATNMLALIFSLGLLYPWTKIRYLKYKMEQSSFACENYEQFESHGYEKGSTVGEEMVDFFDIDIGL